MVHICFPPHFLFSSPFRGILHVVQNRNQAQGLGFWVWAQGVLYKHLYTATEVSITCCKPYYYYFSNINAVLEYDFVLPSVYDNMCALCFCRLDPHDEAGSLGRPQL